MQIHRLLENQAFGPEEIEVLAAVFEDTLRTLRLADRADSATEIVARRVIALAQQGVRDPRRLRERVLQSVSVPEGNAAPPTISSPAPFP
jgi:hypothetical protein